MKDGWKIAFAVLCGVVFGLLGAGLILLIARPPAGQPVALLPPPSPAPVVVHVVGAVLAPGVYTLPAGSRVQDAIRAAGGFSAQADSAAMNLAAPIQDGERLQVAVFSPTATPAAPVRAPVVSIGEENGSVNSSATPGLAHPININTATQLELESLPYIGPATAQKIIAYRQAKGPFKKIEDIMNVSGIGQKTFDRIRPYITVDTVP